MRMDISKSQLIEMKEPGIIKDTKEKILWSKLDVSKLDLKPTPRLFYNKYAFKADIDLPGADIYRQASRFYDYKAFAAYVETRRAGRGSRASWDTRKIENTDSRQLYSIFESTKNYGKKIRVRGEGNHLSVCAESEEILFSVLKNAKLKGLIRTIFRPASEEAMQKLTENTIFVGNPKFKFRAMIRGGYYKADVKRQILNYFNNYKDSIIVTDGVLYNLKQDRDGYVQGYFHVDSTDVLLFLKMIHPRFIGKIFALEAHETK